MKINNYAFETYIYIYIRITYLYLKIKVHNLILQIFYFISHQIFLKF